MPSRSFANIRRRTWVLALPALLAACQAVREIQNVKPITPGAGAITGQVLEQRSGAPIAGARMTLLGADSVTVINQTNYAFSDQRGMFRLGGVLPGVYRVRVEAEGFVSIVSGTIIVRTGTTMSDEYRLSPR